MKHVIYSISDPRTGAMFYIGRTNNLAIRKPGHRCEKTKLGDLIRELEQQGLKPIYNILLECSESEVIQREKEAIRQHRKKYKLMNVHMNGHSDRARFLQIIKKMGISDDQIEAYLKE